eukprot:scaffold2926_cov109-Skeletonema_dohrnii-CCMP3373.AAC.13
MVPWAAFNIMHTSAHRRVGLFSELACNTPAENPLNYTHIREQQQADEDFMQFHERRPQQYTTRPSRATLTS